MAAKKSTDRSIAHDGYGIAESTPISFGISRKWRPRPTLLPIGEITTQDPVAALSKSLTQSN